MSSFHSPRVKAFVEQSADYANTELFFDRTIRALRICFTDEQMRIVWIIAEQAAIDGQLGLWLHTNDSDLLVGQPPSFSVSGAWNQAEWLFAQAVSFLSATFGRSIALRLVAQTVLVSGGFVPNLVAESEAGFSKRQEQQNMFGI